MPHSLPSGTQSPVEPSQDDAMVDLPSLPNTQATNADVAMADATEEGAVRADTLDVKKDVKLEDLFDDVDSDEEFPSSRPVDTPAPSSPPRIAPPQSSAPQPSGQKIDEAIMQLFYKRLFPWRYLFQWLNHSPQPTTDFAHREFAFTLENDAYLRYQSFPSADTLLKDVLRLKPTRFEIGPVYSTNPRDRKTLRNASTFKPLAKELCFDIDLTDYDDIRTCCDKANICIKCWQFITMAIKVVDVALRDDFGFKHIMWVYSGRRGAHAWVCDKKARVMPDQMRRAIAGYLEVVKGGAQNAKKVNLWRPLHPHLTRSLETLKDHFQEDVLEAQDPWATQERAEHLLTLIPDKPLVDALRKKWDAAPGRDSTSKWADIDSVAKTGASKNLDARALKEAKQDIVLEYTYPRLDIEVSKKLNHLLKSPFVIHPGTGRVCVPIDTKALEDFDPTAVPTVHELLDEIDAWTAAHKEVKEEASQEGSQEEKKDAKKGPLDWEKTSLKPYIEYFRGFVAGIIKEEMVIKREREDEGLDF
ncbi:eukaryotic and archaeal DNA primase small subunit [Plectosphaerella plurivora]|uniref:DNA primase n=1 Tax=Plectosphaerella plurivora TaxID=936078 RepID=A0A9P9ABH8_9PEZI|nr:eukaryotic and archaeal DNA primase small subunit [Plectosphaerella plurivora]